MKKFIVFMFLILFAVNSGAEITQKVDSFDGSISIQSMISVSNQCQINKFYNIAVLRTNSASNYLLFLSMCSNKLYIFRNTELELKFDNRDIVKSEYVYQQSSYLSYYPEYKTLSMAGFVITNEIKNRILSANSISFRAYTDVGDIVYDVPESMLSEWKYVLSAPLIAGYQSMYKNITWAMRGSDNYYCVDICDENWNVYEGLRGLQCSMSRSWSPKNYINRVLGVQDGVIKGFKFNWRVWSPSGYGGEGYEGTVTCE